MWSELRVEQAHAGVSYTKIHNEAHSQFAHWKLRGFLNKSGENWKIGNQSSVHKSLNGIKIAVKFDNICRKYMLVISHKKYMWKTITIS